jgi:dolichol-phosphate mannosyltransferase
MKRAEIKAQSATVRGKSLCIVIPTLNEQNNIGVVISRLESLASRLPFEIYLVIVDDHSKDGTREVVKESAIRSSKVKLIERPRPMGIGSAYMTGFSYGLQQYGSDFFGEIDADLQHPPEVLVEMCRLADQGRDVVIASRYIEGGGSLGLSLGRRIVSRSANFLAKILIHPPVADSTSGFRIISARAIKALIESPIFSKGYAFQVESIYIYKKGGMTFAEVPYIFNKRSSGKTKLEWREVLSFAVTLVKLASFGIAKERGQKGLSG